MTADDTRPYHHGRLRPALLAAAEEMLRTQGADQLSLRELARTVGVSHGAPRRHFADRQALLDALAVSGFERLDARLSAALDGANEGFRARLKAAAAAYVGFATDDAALLDLMYSGKHRQGADEVVQAGSAVAVRLHQVIVEGQEAGELAPGNPEEIGIVLFATVHGLAALVNGSMVRPELLGGLVETAVDHFLRGGQPAPGR